MPKKSHCATKLQNPSSKTSEHLIVTDMCNRHYGWVSSFLFFVLINNKLSLCD
jgi:hypothetical protein